MKAYFEIVNGEIIYFYLFLDLFVPRKKKPNTPVFYEKVSGIYNYIENLIVVEVYKNSGSFCI